MRINREDWRPNSGDIINVPVGACLEIVGSDDVYMRLDRVGGVVSHDTGLVPVVNIETGQVYALSPRTQVRALSAVVTVDFEGQP